MTDMRSQGRRKSNFPALDNIPSDATFDFVSGGTNYKITVFDFFQGLGVSGTIVQSGEPTGTPILDSQGSSNKIRNISNGPGAKASINAYNGVTIAHNFLQDGNGVPLLRDATRPQPIFASLAEGNGISLSSENNRITISVSGTAAQSKVIPVNELGDFPDAVSGVITLAPDVTYLLSNDITTSNRFVLQDGTALVGLSPSGAKLTYTGTGSMFTATDSQVFFDNFLADCPNANAFNINETGTPSKIFSCSTVLFENCISLGTFSDCNAVNILNSNCRNCESGAVFSGTQWRLISIDRLAMFGSLGTFVGIDLGNTICNSIELQDLLLAGPTGAIGISGLPNSGNITVDNLGTITNCNFLGDITPEGGGIDAQNSIRWETAGNDGIEDTRPDALISLTANVTETVISTANVPVKVSGTWVLQEDSIYVGDASGRVTYLGERIFKGPIDATLSVLAAAGGDKQITSYMALNGVVLPETAVTETVSSTKSGSFSMIWQYAFTEGDYVEVFIENNTNTENLIVNGVLRVN